MATPLVSIVVPARNMAPFIGETLRSALSQSIDSIEVIVVDDGSTDGTGDIVEAIGDPRVRLIRNPTGSGVSAARNTGVAASTAPFLVYLDADDLLTDGALEALLTPLQEQSGYVASMGRIACIAENGDALPERARRIRDVPNRDTLRHLLAKNFIQPGTLCVRTETARSAGAFRQDLSFGEDWEYWCRLALLGDFLPVPRTVLLYRIRTAGASRRLRGTLHDFNRTAIETIYSNPEIRARLTASELARLKRTAEIDTFWNGIRAEIALGSKLRALPAAMLGLLRYPDSVLRPRLAYYFVTSLFSGETRQLSRSSKSAGRN